MNTALGYWHSTDLATFIVQMTQSLAWPLVVLIVSLVFKNSLVDALEHLASLKLPGGVEATFEREIKAVEVTAEEIEPPKDNVAKANQAKITSLIEMAATSPTGAIVEAWKEVEAAARRVAETSGISLTATPSRPYFNLQSFLQRNELLPPAEIDMFRELRLLRNRAAHSQDADITTEHARRYVRLAEKLIDAMDSFRSN